MVLSVMRNNARSYTPFQNEKPNQLYRSLHEKFNNWYMSEYYNGTDLEKIESGSMKRNEYYDEQFYYFLNMLEEDDLDKITEKYLHENELWIQCCFHDMITDTDKLFEYYRSKYNINIYIETQYHEYSYNFRDIIKIPTLDNRIYQRKTLKDNVIILNSNNDLNKYNVTYNKYNLVYEKYCWDEYYLCPILHSKINEIKHLFQSLQKYQLDIMNKYEKHLNKYEHLNHEQYISNFEVRDELNELLKEEYNEKGKINLGAYKNFQLEEKSSKYHTKLNSETGNNNNNGEDYEIDPFYFTIDSTIHTKSSHDYHSLVDRDLFSIIQDLSFHKIKDNESYNDNEQNTDSENKNEKDSNELEKNLYLDRISSCTIRCIERKTPHYEIDEDEIEKFETIEKHLSRYDYYTTGEKEKTMKMNEKMNKNKFESYHQKQNTNNKENSNRSKYEIPNSNLSKLMQKYQCIDVTYYELKKSEDLIRSKLGLSSKASKQELNNEILKKTEDSIVDQYGAKVNEEKLDRLLNNTHFKEKKFKEVKKKLENEVLGQINKQYKNMNIRPVKAFSEQLYNLIYQSIIDSEVDEHILSNRDLFLDRNTRYHMFYNMINRETQLDPDNSLEVLLRISSKIENDTTIDDIRRANTLRNSGKLIQCPNVYPFIDIFTTQKKLHHLKVIMNQFNITENFENTNFVTKKFLEKELNELIEKYLHLEEESRNYPVLLIAKSLIELLEVPKDYPNSRKTYRRDEWDYKEHYSLFDTYYIEPCIMQEYVSLLCNIRSPKLHKDKIMVDNKVTFGAMKEVYQCFNGCIYENKK
jgi:hypothetical protein